MTTAAAATGSASSRTLAHPEPGDVRLEAVLHALADPMRMRVVRELAREESAGGLSCSYFALPVTKSTCTHHFRVLRESGVIRQIYRGTTKLNVLRRDDLDVLFPGLLDSVLDAATRQETRLEGAGAGA